MSCFAFNGDKTKLALCPNNSEIWIYSKSGDDWEEECVLKEHSELVTGLDWGVKTNRIVSCSQVSRLVGEVVALCCFLMRGFF